MAGWKSPNGLAQHLARGAIITQIGSVEWEYYKACTGVICKTSYELVHVLQFYNLQKVEPDKCDVGVNNKLIDWFLSNPALRYLSEYYIR